jgi:Uma2 family endonuclease
MSVMATGNLLTRADLDALQDDGLRHELIDGAFVMTPAPGLRHQAMSAALYRTLWSASTDTDLKVLYAPFDVVLGPNVVEPDLIVAPGTAFTERDLPIAPPLVVEVRSPTTGWLDEGRKRTLYEEYGVPSYWLVDPQTPSVTILELIDGSYREVARAHGDQAIEVSAPLPVTLNPANLAKG